MQATLSRLNPEHDVTGVKGHACCEFNISILRCSGSGSSVRKVCIRKRAVPRMDPGSAQNQPVRLTNLRCPLLSRSRIWNLWWRRSRWAAETEITHRETESGSVQRFCWTPTSGPFILETQNQAEPNRMDVIQKFWLGSGWTSGTSSVPSFWVYLSPVRT